MIVALYARYSSDNQRVESIVAQLRACREYCQKYGYTIIKEYADEAMTGTNDNRPQFQQMMRDAEAGMFEMIVAHKVDRIGRDEFDYYYNRHRLEACGVGLAFAAQGFDVSTPEGALMNNTLVGLAAYYSRNLAKEVQKGQRENALQGKTNGGKPLFGYKYAPDKTYLVDEHEAEGVRMIFDMYLQGAGYLEIASALNERGFRTRRGNKFGKNSLHELLRNRRYIGTVVWGHNTKMPNGKRNNHRPPHKDTLVIPNGCPAIIDKETFALVQEKMEQRRKHRGMCTARHTYLLTPLVFCAHCGAAMGGVAHRNQYGVLYRYYRCQRKTRMGTDICPNHSMRADVLEDLIIGQIRKLFLNPDAVEKLMASVDEQYRILKENDCKSLEGLKTKKAAVMKKINSYLEYIEEYGMPDRIAHQRYQGWISELEKLEAEISRREASVPAPLSRAVIRQYIDKYSNALASGSAGNIKNVIAAFVSKIKISRDEISVSFKFRVFGSCTDDGAVDTAPIWIQLFEFSTDFARA